MTALRLLVATSATCAGLLALAAAAGGTTAGGPLPWCGVATDLVDRQPDATVGLSTHLVYAYPADGTDRLPQVAPLIVGDVAAAHEWWQREDPARYPRFDFYPYSCDSHFGRLDISRVQLSQRADAYAGAGAYGAISTEVRRRSSTGEEKVLLIYYDGPRDLGRACGDGAPRVAVVYLRTCGHENDHDFRAAGAVHELLHAFGFAAGSAHACPGDPGHVCDNLNDILAPAAHGGAAGAQGLSERVLDAGRDDYYGHGGPAADARASPWLEPLDGAERARPSVPARVFATNDRRRLVTLRWEPARDDAAPVRYLVYRNGRATHGFFGPQIGIAETRLLVLPDALETTYGVRAVDDAGRLSEMATLRFRIDYGIVDANGRLLQDTVPPSAVSRVAVTRRRGAVLLRWRPAADGAGIRGYEISVAGRRVRVVRAPMLALPKKLRGRRIGIAAIDVGGNVGPRIVVAGRRLR